MQRCGVSWQQQQQHLSHPAVPPTTTAPLHPPMRHASLHPPQLNSNERPVLTPIGSGSSLLSGAPVPAKQLHITTHTKVQPSLPFLQILQSVGAKGDQFTVKELIIFLKDYIVVKQLYDEGDPRIVYCSNDELGRVFGLAFFTIADVMKLLQANCTVIDEPTSEAQGYAVMETSVDTLQESPKNNSKMSTAENKDNSLLLNEKCRQISDLKTDNEVCVNNLVKQSPRKRPSDVNLSGAKDCKVARRSSSSINQDEKEKIVSGNSFPWFYKQHCHDSDDSEVLSIQSKETEYVKDSSDDLWFVEGENEDDEDSGSVFSVEYEVESDASDTCEEDPELSHSDTDEESSKTKLDDSELNFWADSSDMSSDESDTETTKNKNSWTCRECQSSNPETERHCGRCWKLRPGWLSSQQSSKRFSRHAISRSNGYASSDLDSDNEEQMPWLPVEKALQKLRSSEKVLDTDSHHTVSGTGEGTSASLQQGFLPTQQPSESSKLLPPQHSMPSCSYINREKTVFKSQGPSHSVEGNKCGVQKSVPALLPVSTISFSQTPSPICAASNYSMTLPSLVQRSSTPVTTSTDFLHKDSSQDGHSLNQSSNLNMSLKSCGDASLNLHDSGISSVDGNISETLPSSLNFSERKHNISSVSTKCHSAPSTPVKNDSCDRRCMLSPMKRQDMLDKYKGRLFPETRWTLFQYQKASSSTSSASHLKHSVSDPTISNNISTVANNSSTNLACRNESNKSVSQEKAGISLNNNLSLVPAITVTPPEEIELSTNTTKLSTSKSLPNNFEFSRRPVTRDIPICSSVCKNELPQPTEQKDVCVICLTEPKDASIIHGRTGHQVCCYSCAKRLRRRGKPCPVCRRPINRVIKNYVM